MSKALLGLLGYPLSHSFSPSYFNAKFSALDIDAEYQLFEIESPDHFSELFKNENLLFFNVTIPHKQAIIPFLDELSEDSRAIGAVNTIVLHQGKKYGFNTDWQGFTLDIKPQISGISRALVLGTGGSSKAIVYALQKMNVQVFTVGRNQNQADFIYSQIPNDFFKDPLLIVNCTPLGMSPNIDICPDFPYSWVNENHYAYDLIYNPEATLFLKKCKAQGARVKNGQDMLILQAEKAWELCCNFHPHIL